MCRIRRMRILIRLSRLATERRYRLLIWLVPSQHNIFAKSIFDIDMQHAHAAENLLPFLKPGNKVLDVGSGSGYTCAVFYHLVCATSDGESASSSEKQGKVVGIDHIPQLVEWSEGNLRRDGLGDALRDGRVVMVAGDGREGYAEDGG